MEQVPNVPSIEAVEAAHHSRHLPFSSYNSFPMLTALLSHTAFREMIADCVLLACLVLAWYFPQIGDGLFHRLEVLGARLANHQRLAVVAIAALTIFLRLSLLWILPVPIPVIQDEFSYLLAADTFAHGRLTNPPSPFWIFFDEVHVNQLPTYMSKYPPAQGAVIPGSWPITGSPLYRCRFKRRHHVCGYFMDAPGMASSRVGTAGGHTRSAAAGYFHVLD